MKNLAVGYSSSLFLHVILLLSIYQTTTVQVMAPATKKVNLNLLQTTQPASSVKQTKANPTPKIEKQKRLPEKVVPEIQKKVLTPEKPQQREKTIAVATPKQVSVEKKILPQPHEIQKDAVLNDKLFSNKNQKITKQNTAVIPAKEASETTAPTISKEDFWRHKHFLAIKEAIQQNMKYPSIARRNGWQGKVLVSFVIMDDGRIENVSIVESSGFNLLDKNAVSTIRRAAPFPRPPTRITIVVPIFYDLS